MNKLLERELRYLFHGETNPTYAGGKSGGSPEANKLLETIRSVDLNGLSNEQVDHICRLFERFIAVCRLKWMGERYSINQWTLKRGHPGTQKGEHYPNHRPWHDHLSILIDKKTKKKIFRSEPYHILKDDIVELAELVKEGWNVSISAMGSTHFVGSTVEICIEKAAPASMAKEGL